MRLPDRRQGLTPTENVDGSLILRTALPAQWAVCQPHQMEVPAQGIVPGKNYGDHPGLSPSKGQKPNPVAPTGPGDQLSSLSFGAPKFHHRLLCWFSNQRLILIRKSCPEVPKVGSGPTKSEAEQFQL
jgi:hypothetical protein